MMTPKLSILAIIRSLGHGGAERQLIELARSIDRRCFGVALVTFYDGGALREAAQQIPGLSVYSLEKKGRWDFQCLPRLIRLVRHLRPDLVMGYISTGHLMSLLAGKAAGSRVIWSVRGSNNRELGHYTRIDQMTFRVAGLLSRFANLAIFNSEAGRDYYLKQGYQPPKTAVIPNGIDTAYFSYRAEAASQLRRQWKIPATAPLIGLVARLDPVKDHWTFLVAASMLLRHRPEVHFVCVGSGLSEYAQKLESFASELGIQEHVHWTGTMNDMPAVYSALDLNTLCTAFGEGFPNSVAEAMSCGIPCVVTPAGDSARIVGETGLVVDARSAEGLAKAWRQLLELSTEERTALKNNARERIVSNFPIELMIRRTEQALISVEGLAA